MLLYHPFFDAYHCCFRLLRLLQNLGTMEIEADRLRVWDFYLLFPSMLETVRLPKEAMSVRKEAQKRKSMYEVLPDARRAFLKLEPMQNAALDHLAAIKLINPEKLRAGVIQATDVDVPFELGKLISIRNNEDAMLVEFLTTKFLEVPLFGKDGLRVRTDLFDSRYDIS